MAESDGKFKLTKGKIISWGLLLLGIYLIYRATIGANVTIRPTVCYFYVQRPSEVKIIADTLKESGIISSRLSLRIMAKLMGLKTIKPGMYELRQDWDNIHLVKHFKTHKPKKTKFIKVPAMQLRNNLIQGMCKGTGIHPDDVWRHLNNKKFTKELGNFSTESIFSMFIPGEYRVYENIDSKLLLKRMYSEYLIFWNNERLEKAEEIGLKPEEITILASIVYSETKIREEMPIIAGVYINRLQRNMRLESDPTLIFAAKKYGSKRVLNDYKNVDSPYNTYKRRGLPPGPIATVPPWVIDQVLDYEGHDFIYFCAKSDFSGEHLFAETFEEHIENARVYREELNSKRIY